MIEIDPVVTPSLETCGYVATDGAVAVVVDPPRDYDRVLALTERRGRRITHVLETHIHHDHVTGGLRLARRVGARYVVPVAEPVTFEREPAGDGHVVDAGRMRIRALHTPGHTFTHLSYVVETEGRPLAVFTGGSLLSGSTGRPDLLGVEHTDALARQQYHSARRLADELPGEVAVYPAYGRGSFCSCAGAASSGPASFDGAGSGASTIGEQALHNPALTLDEEAYVRAVLAGLDSFPAYYPHAVAANVAGPAEIDLAPPEPAGPDQLRRRIRACEWVVDLRPRGEWARGHLPGTLNVGLDGRFVTYLGWLIRWGTPVTLLGETPDQVALAQRDLARIGIDRPAAAATGTVREWAAGAPLASVRTVTFADLRAAMQSGQPPYVLDVRRHGERRRSRILGSRHIPLHDLPSRLSEVPLDETIWVHCAVGYRAALAASLLDRAGARVVLVDDSYDRAAPADLPLRGAA